MFTVLLDDSGNPHAGELVKDAGNNQPRYGSREVPGVYKCYLYMLDGNADVEQGDVGWDWLKTTATGRDDAWLVSHASQKSILPSQCTHTTICNCRAVIGRLAPTSTSGKAQATGRDNEIDCAWQGSILGSAASAMGRGRNGLQDGTEKSRASSSDSGGTMACGDTHCWEKSANFLMG